MRAIQPACRSIDQNFRPNDVRATCLPGRSGQKYDLKVVLKQDVEDKDVQVLTHEECISRFQKVIDNCTHGGSSDSGTFVFTYVSTSYKPHGWHYGNEELTKFHETLVSVRIVEDARNSISELYSIDSCYV